MNIKNFIKRNKTGTTTLSTNDGSGEEATTRRFDLVGHTAHKAQIYMWGNGFTLLHSNTTILDQVLQILNLNKFEMLGNQTEYNISAREDGNQIIYTQPDIEGNVRIGLVDMESSSSVVTDQYGNILSGMTYITGQYGMLAFKIIQMWGPHKMTSTMEFKDNDGNYIPFNPASEADQKKYNSLPLSYKFLSEWEYEEIPLTLITNFESVGFKSRGDALHARGLQEVLDKSFVSSEYELEENITRITGQLNDAEVKRGNYKGFGGRKKVMSVNGFGEDKNGNINVIQGNPALGVFNEHQTEIINKYMEAANYSRENDFNASTVIVGVLFKGKADIETTNLKKGLREQAYKDLIKTVIRVHNQFNPIINVPEDEPINFQLNSFVALDKEQKALDIEKMKEYGILTYGILLDHFFNLKGDAQAIEQAAKKIGVSPDAIVEKDMGEEEENGNNNNSNNNSTED